MNVIDLIPLFDLNNKVAESTMMGAPCLRYNGDFLGMWFDKEESLIVKITPDRVNELIADGLGKEFNYTGKRFKEWVLIPLDFEEDYPSYLEEALAYAKLKQT